MEKIYKTNIFQDYIHNLPRNGLHFVTLVLCRLQQIRKDLKKEGEGRRGRKQAMYSAMITTATFPTGGNTFIPLQSSKQSSLFGTYPQKLFFPVQKMVASPLSSLNLPSIEAKAATRRASRIARHERIRKKVCAYAVSLSRTIEFCVFPLKC